MTSRIGDPVIELHDSNGNPYVGAVLKVYQTGTTTYASLFSDDGLSVALTNPLSGANASNAAGRFPQIFIAAGVYDLRAETSSGTLIWEYPDYDTGLGFSGGPLAISAGGTGATSAASALSNLGAASASSVTDLAADISDILATLQNIVNQPQGYLTLTSLTPVITSDVSAGTSVYYTPDKGNLIPIYDGIQFNPSSFAELTLTLVANHVASSIYDVFSFLDSGSAIIGTGPAWNSATAGSSSRGTGSGTTELTRIRGLFVNANAMTARNGSTTYSVSANQGTYLGSIYMDGTNGQVSALVGYGLNRKWGVWNAYNQRDIILKSGSTSASWTYGTDTWRQTDAGGAGTGAKITIFSGLPDTRFDIDFVQRGQSADSTSSYFRVGIGIDSTTSPSGFFGQFGHSDSGSETFATQGMAVARYAQQAITGISNVNCLERGVAGTSTLTGTESASLMTIRYKG